MLFIILFFTCISTLFAADLPSDNGLTLSFLDGKSIELSPAEYTHFRVLKSVVDDLGTSSKESFPVPVGTSDAFKFILDVQKGGSVSGHTSNKLVMAANQIDWLHGSETLLASVISQLHTQVAGGEASDENINLNVRCADQLKEKLLGDMRYIAPFNKMRLHSKVMKELSHDFCFSPTMKYLFNPPHIICVSSGERVHRVNNFMDGMRVDFSKFIDSLLLVQSTEKNMSVIDLETKKIAPIAIAGDEIMAYAFSPDNKTLAVGMRQAIEFFDILSHKSQKTISTRGDILYLEYSKDKTVLVGLEQTIGSKKQKIIAWDGNTLNRIMRHNVQKASRLKILQDGKSLQYTISKQGKRHHYRTDLPYFQNTIESRITAFLNNGSPVTISQPRVFRSYSRIHNVTTKSNVWLPSFHYLYSPDMLTVVQEKISGIHLECISAKIFYLHFTESQQEILKKLPLSVLQIFHSLNRQKTVELQQLDEGIDLLQSIVDAGVSDEKMTMQMLAYLQDHKSGRLSCSIV